MNWRVSIILLLLFGAGLLLVWRPFESDRSDADNRRSQIMKPDFIANGLKTRIFEAAGDLAHQLDASHMAHYVQIGLTELEQPVYSVFNENDQATWRISAEQGTFYDDQTLILERNVEITSLQPDTSIDRVVTEYLVIEIPAEVMKTDYPVTIFGPQLTIRGDGLSADLYAEKMELERHVETVFNPR